MRILVTGGAGFIGSHIVDRYIAEGHEVVVVDNLSSGKAEQVNPQAKLYVMDICDPALAQVLETEKIECVNHQAAQANVRRSVADPVADGEINIIGSLNLLHHAIRCGVKHCIFASTGGAIYGEQETFPAEETHPLNPVSPYGVAKLAVEKYLFCFQQIHGISYTALRYANVYGPRQDPHGEAGVVAIFTERLLRNEPPVINGDGEQTRDYVYIDDVVEANVLALRHTLSGAFNVGTGIETSVNTLYRRLKALIPTPVEAVHGPPKEGEQRRSLLSSRRLQAQTGWAPRISLEEGLAKTVAYFRQQHA
ncbi:MAG: NAD-dependent epimerase/dehydratase family protein [Nitrospinota bacterium]|nr:MAG: NAD-dependent epimerase/dehydratase family protein [Nitrospinota bacterium]